MIQAQHNSTPGQPSLQDFEAVLRACQAAAQEGDLTTYRNLDTQLRGMAEALLQDGEGHLNVLKEAVTRLGRTASTVEQDRKKLKARRRSDQKVRVAYGRAAGWG